MVEIEIDHVDGEFRLKNRRALEDLGYTLGENPYINIIDNHYEDVELWCPRDNRRLFWNGAKGHFECLDCPYVPPDPRIEALKKQQKKDQELQALHPSRDNNKRIRTRRGRIATGDRYNAIPAGLEDSDGDTGSAMEFRPILSMREGLRKSPQDGPVAYTSRSGEMPLDQDERNLLDRGYTLKNRSEISGSKNTMDTEQQMNELRRRLGRERARSRLSSSYSGF